MMGQGANSAIADAICLAKFLAQARACCGAVDAPSACC